MIGLAVVLVAILGCAALQYFKGTVVKAFAAIIVAICASAVAFGYFEVLANVFISRFPSLIPWAQPLSFALLFVVAFAILQTAVVQLARQEVDLGVLPERIGRVICGILLGFILSGLLLTTLAMAPLPNKYPYQRFDERNPAAQRPDKVLLNADGFTAGWFSLMSKGSFRAIRNPRSFAVLHPSFLDQVFLNRHNDSGDIPLLTSAESIDVPKKNGAWYAPVAGIKDADGNPIAPESNHRLIIVRMGIRKNAINDAGKFTLAQLRLICKPRSDTKGPLAGKGINVYPIGYVSGQNRIQRKKLSELITVSRDDFGQETIRHIDFAFGVPDDHTPVLLEFKLNNIVEVPRPVSEEQAPPPSPFVERTRTGTGPSARNESAGQRQSTSGQRNQGRGLPRRRGLSDTSRSIVGDGFD
ncbi:MAG: CvpA family protein [Phycisphaerales bacterium]|jgi:hypothetical protein